MAQACKPEPSHAVPRREVLAAGHGVMRRESRHGNNADLVNNAVNSAAAARSRAAPHARSAGHCGAARDNNVETLHPVEILHAYSVFYFRRMQSFHANGGQAPMARLLSGAWSSTAPRLP